MNHYFKFSFSFVLLFITSCSKSHKNDKFDSALEAIGINSKYKVIRYSDFHGGFHGDGDLILNLQLQNFTLDDVIKSGWRKLKMPKKMEMLLFGGKYNETYYEGILLFGLEKIGIKSINGLINTNTGHYFFYDKQIKSHDDISIHKLLFKEHYSHNFIFCIIDEKGNLWYFETDS